MNERPEKARAMDDLGGHGSKAAHRVSRGKDSSSPQSSTADRLSVSLNASRTDDALFSESHESAESAPCGLPRPSEGCATGILWLAPETPLFLCDDHVTEYADLRFARSTSAGPDDVGLAREAAYGILVENRPDCVECSDPGTVRRWSP